MITPSDTQQAFKVVSDHGFAQVLLNKSLGQKALHAAKHFSPGEVISPFHAGSTLAYPTYLTVQVSDDKHITLQPEFLQYINHSCDPNVFFDTTSMELICLKALQPGDELTFFYPSTEWEMAQPFNCHCGSTNCLKVIGGAAQIPVAILNRYKLTDFIRGKVENARE
jgi:hypothetical protein